MKRDAEELVKQNKKLEAMRPDAEKLPQVINELKNVQRKADDLAEKAQQKQKELERILDKECEKREQVERQNEQLARKLQDNEVKLDKVLDDL